MVKSVAALASTSIAKGIDHMEMKETILIIEDNQTEQRFIQKTLTKKGYKTLVTGTGKQGLEMAKIQKVDLIILDINLPDIQGDAVLEELKQNTKTRLIPVLTLTVVKTPSAVINHFELGAMNYLIKPINGKQLISQVGSILSNENNKA